jgi:hypothetical protein
MNPIPKTTQSPQNAIHVQPGIQNSLTNYQTNSTESGEAKRCTPSKKFPEFL